MEKISALMDGELDSQEAGRQLKRLKQDAALLEGWHAYHLIGDTLRGESPLLSAKFQASLAQALSAEPTVLAPRRFTVTPNRATTYALSAAATIAAVSFVGWMALAPTPDAPRIVVGPKLPVVVADTPSVASVVSDARMNEYMLAHQGFSPSTAIQGLAPYIRSVSATRTVEGR